VKQLVLGFLALSVLLSSPAFAQYEEEIELTRAIIRTERQELITAGMDLDADERDAFWPLYLEYRREMDTLGDRQVQLITDYADNFMKMTDAAAEVMLDEYLGIQRAELKLRTRYVKRFRKILPPKKVTRFFQLENKLDAVIDHELARQIPLVE
jgi:hypothetical protein